MTIRPRIVKAQTPKTLCRSSSQYTHSRVHPTLIPSLTAQVKGTTASRGPHPARIFLFLLTTPREKYSLGYPPVLVIRSASIRRRRWTDHNPSLPPPPSSLGRTLSSKTSLMFFAKAFALARYSFLWMMMRAVSFGGTL